MPAGFFTLSGPCIAIETLATGRNTDLIPQKRGAVTEVAEAATVTLQASGRTSCALALCLVCIVSLPTFGNTKTAQEEKRGWAKAALVCLVALKAGLITPLARVRFPEKSWRALFHTSSFMENVALHALQAVSPLGTFAGITAPVTLSASLAGKIQVILLSTALILALPKEQDLGWISARCAAGGRVAAPALAAARSAGLPVIPVVSWGTERSTRARVGQNQAGVAGRAGEGTLCSAGFT